VFQRREQKRGKGFDELVQQMNLFLKIYLLFGANVIFF
jgi:hypothetical protein